jgi:hypothetical protein
MTDQGGYDPSTGPRPPRFDSPATPVPATARPPRSSDVDRWGYPAAAPPPAPAPPPPTDELRPERKRPARALWLAGAAAVVVTAAVVTAVLVSGGGGPTPPPATTVLAYLSDLAAGDAAGALAQGPPPPSARFTTGPVLAQQQHLASLTDISLAAAHVDGGHATVGAQYRLGKAMVATSFALQRSGGRWRLTATTFRLDTSGLAGIPEPTLFGQPVSGLATAYVFPGPLVWGSSNRFFSVAQRSASYATSPQDSPPNIALRSGLNRAGTRAVHAALSRYLATCVASTRAAPPGCPQQEDAGGVLAGSVRWGTPSTSGVKVTTDEDSLTTLQVQGPLTFRCTYQVRSGHRNVTMRDNDVPGDIEATIDMTQQTPTLVITG